ncbi:MAG: hypothetical protein AAFU78_15410 [Cyanobacteria bacterium J06633_2]
MEIGTESVKKITDFEHHWVKGCEVVGLDLLEGVKQQYNGYKLSELPVDVRLRVQQALPVSYTEFNGQVIACQEKPAAQSAKGKAVVFQQDISAMAQRKTISVGGKTMTFNEVFEKHSSSSVSPFSRMMP